jgi:hypothetical protein
MNRVLSTFELQSSERAFVAAMQRPGFGRFEFLRIANGGLVLDPGPTTVGDVKSGSEDAAASQTPRDEFQLKRRVIELFEYVCEVDTAEIRTFEIRDGLPFSMEVQLAGARTTVMERAAVADCPELLWAWRDVAGLGDRND